MRSSLLLAGCAKTTWLATFLVAQTATAQFPTSTGMERPVLQVSQLQGGGLEPPPPPVVDVEAPPQPGGGLEPGLPGGSLEPGLPGGDLNPAPDGLEPGRLPGVDGKKGAAMTFATSDSTFYPQAVFEQSGGKKSGSSAYAYGPTAQALQGQVLNSTYSARVRGIPDLLPAPNDGNDLFYTQLEPWDQRLHLGTQPLGYSHFFGASDAIKNIWTRFKASPHFGFFYDTGFVDGDIFSVGSIALGDDPRAGQTTFTGSSDELVPLTLLSDAQLLNFAGLGNQQVQVLVQANNHRKIDELQVDQLYVRAWNYDRLAVSGGKGFSLFGVGGSMPANLTQAGILVGSAEIIDNDKPVQLRMQVAPESGGWGWGVAVEDPRTPDFSAPSGNELQRWPTFAAQTAYKGEDGVDRVQFSALARNLGFESAARTEHFTAGYGFAAYALLGSKSDAGDRQGVYAGVAGGEGIGHYIHGITRAAEFDGTDLRPLSAFGAYVGVKREWENCNGTGFGVNAAYGYAHMESHPAFGTDVDQELQQAWANFIVFPSSNVGLGVEYQFGRRETHDGLAGENHRFLIIAAFTTSGAATRGVAAASGASAAAFDTSQTAGNAAMQRF